MKKLWLCILAVCILCSCVTAFAEERNDEMSSKNVSIVSETGLTLRGYLKGPASALEGGESCPLILLMHGLMDSGEFELIQKQADAYVQAGYAVLAVDFNGHGHSDGKLIDMTISRELQDAEAILAYAKQLPFASEIILIGHSQGGAVAAVTAARHPGDIDRLVLLAPGGALADKIRSGSFFGTTFDPADPPEKIQAFDDYVGREYLLDAAALDLYGMAEGYHDRPVLLVRGSEDPLVNEEAIEHYQQIYEKPEVQNEVTLHTIEGAPHDFAGYEDQVIALVLENLGDPSFHTLPMSEEAGERREAMRQSGSAETFSEANFPQILQLITSGDMNVYPEADTEHPQGHLTIGGNNVYTLENDDASCVILYIHGGAYVFGIDAVHIQLCDKMATRMNASVYMPLYPLAPNHTWQEAYPFLDAVYDELLTQGKTIYLMGDSAGGGLSLAFSEHLRDAGKPLPEKIVLYSPWLDVTMSNPEIQAYEEKDLQLKSFGLVECGKAWAGELDTRDPKISPIYGDLKDLPPIMLFTGTDEVMFPDVTKLYHLLKQEGNPASLVYGEGLWHVFVASNIPEADMALDLVEAFCR